MPSHDSWFNISTMEQIRSIQPKKVLDIGVGNGDWGRFVRDEFPDCYIVGIEVFPSYITPELNKIYNEILLMDVRDFLFEEGGDLVIFGDVLEHMEKEDALELVDLASNEYKWMIINTPYGFLPQDEWEGNKYETHICGFYADDFSDYDVIETNIRQQMSVSPLMNLLIKNE